MKEKLLNDIENLIRLSNQVEASSSPIDAYNRDQLNLSICLHGNISW